WLVRGNGYQKARITFAIYRFFLLKRPIQSGGRFIVFVPPETVARWRISNGQTGELSPVCIRLSRPVSVGSSFGRKLYLKSTLCIVLMDGIEIRTEIRHQAIYAIQISSRFYKLLQLYQGFVIPFGIQIGFPEQTGCCTFGYPTFLSGIRATDPSIGYRQ